MEKLPTRISKKDYYMEVARVISMRSTCLRRHYGAVIVNNDEIIATGYNGSPRGVTNCCDVGICNRVGATHNDGNYGSCPAVHAEQNAIISASRKDMLGATMYLYGEENGERVDAEPCPICLRMIKNAGIERIITSRKCKE